MNAPVVPADFKNVIIAPTATFCLAFVRLFLRIPVLLYQLTNWMLASDGSVSAAFRNQLWPAGSVILSAAASAPAGQWLECNGSAVNRTTYATLYSAIASTYGNGDGTTTFNLPDLRGRAPIGAGTLVKADATSGATYDVAQKIGLESVVLTMENLPSEPPPLGSKVDFLYVHGVLAGSSYAATNIVPGASDENHGRDNSRTDHLENALADLGTDVAHENRSPSLVMRYWISY